MKYDWLKTQEQIPSLNIKLPEFKKVRVWELDLMIDAVVAKPEIQASLFEVDAEAKRRGHEVLRLWSYGNQRQPEVGMCKLN